MTEQEIKDLVTRQRKHFQTGATLPVSARVAALRRLYAAISSNEKEILNALKKILEKVDLKAICVKPDLFWKRSAIC